LRFNRLMPLLPAAAILLAAAPGPAEDKDDKGKTTFQSKPAGQYPHRQSSENVTIAAQPFLTDEEAKEPFGKVNPWRYGVLPVLVVIQNDGKDTLRLERMKVSYVLPDNSRIEATPAGDVRFLLGVKAPKSIPGPSLPGVHIGGVKKSPLNEWEIEGRAFAAKVIPPGQSASGFFYFQTDVNSAASSVYIAGLSNAVSGRELYYFEIPLSGK
jgi:hypothetical protein